MSTLWQEEEFKQICSRESLTEKAANIEKTIVVKEHERARYDFDPTMFYENRFWNRRPDGIVINKAGRPRRKEGEWGEGPSLAITTMGCSEFA